jgi:ELWxxDGT repeat protein
VKTLLSIAFPVVLGDKIYFSGSDSTDGYELWQSDGTPGGTTRVANINTSGGSNPQNITVYNNRLIFSAIDGTNGLELWISDGTNAGTYKPVFPGSSVSPVFQSVKPFVEYNGSLYLSARYDSTGYELWRFHMSPVGLQGSKALHSIFSVSPNPVRDVLHIDHAGIERGVIIIQDVSGRVLMRKALANDIDLSNLARDIYYLTLTDSENGSSSTQKIIKE